MTQTQSPKLAKRKRKGEGYHCNVLCVSVHHTLFNAQRKALENPILWQKGCVCTLDSSKCKCKPTASCRQQEDILKLCDFAQRPPADGARSTIYLRSCI